MRLKAVILLCIGAASLSGVIASGVMIRDAVQRYTENRIAGEAIQVAGLLLAIPPRLSTERGPYNVVLTGEGVATAKDHAEIAAAAAASDAALAAAITAIRHTSYAAATAQAVALEALWGELKAQRAKVEPMLAVPRQQRNGDVWAELTRTMLGYNARVIAMVDVLDPLAAAANGDLTSYLDIARKSWNIRDAAGQRSALLITAITSGVPIPTAMADRVNELYGRLDQDWQSILGSMRRLGDPPALLQAVGTVKARFFGDSFAAYDAVIAAGRSDGKYPMTVADYRTRHIPGLDSTLLPRDAALEVAAAVAAEARSDALSNLAGAVGILLSVLLTLGIVAVIVTWRIATPFAALTNTIGRLANGDLTAAITGQDRSDEIGRMAQALLVFRANALAAREVQQAADAAHAAKARRQAAMDRYTSDFGTSAAGVMASLVRSADTMRETSAEMSTAAQRTRTDATRTADGAAESTRNLSAVAAAAEQMSASIAEIGQQVSRAAVAAQEAVERTSATDARVNDMAAAADRVGHVVQLINAIASQTNLLALNATIEAARAGDAGKGFAVVAGEVKALAAQTAKATEEIGQHIAAIRAATDQAVHAVREVGVSIGRVDEVASAIAAAVEQQAAVTQGIVASVQTVSAATEEATQAMQQVSQVAEATDTASRTVLVGADEVSRNAATLGSEIDAFLQAMAGTEEKDRRLYERIPGNGTVAQLRPPGVAELRVPVVDISRGGVAVRCDWTAQAGTRVQLLLPGTEVSAAARVVRSADGLLGLAFAQEAATLALVDAALRHVSGPAVRAAA